MQVHLYAGASRESILPDPDMYPLPQREGMLYDCACEPIFVRAVAIRQESGLFFCLSFELFGTPFAQTLREQLCERYGVSPERVLICDTYNHYAPREDLYRFDTSACGSGAQARTDSYFSMCLDRAHAAVRRALENLEPARLGIAGGCCPISMNRDRELNGEWILGKNPDGARDWRFTLICLERMSDGEPIAMAVNYSLYGNMCYLAPVCGGQELAVNGDLPGRVCSALETCYPSCCAMWLCAAAGDQDPLFLSGLSQWISPREQLRRQLSHQEAMLLRECHAQWMVGEILRAMGRMEWLPSSELEGATVDCRLRHRDASIGDVEVQALVLRLGDRWCVATSGAPTMDMGRRILECLPGGEGMLVTHAGPFTGYLVTSEGCGVPTFESVSMALQPGDFEAAILPRLKEAVHALHRQGAGSTTI